jgi:hypothetical protein
MERWAAENVLSALRRVFKTGDSLMLTQQCFRLRFNKGRVGKFPNTILLWIANFRSTDFLMSWRL